MGGNRVAYFDSDGVQIYYEEHGTGEPVVLVHGFASRAEHNWGLTGWYMQLSPHYRVVALDCRGHGKSGKPHDPAAYAGNIMANDVIRLMDQLGIERTLLMGYSMGARISLGLLQSHPERLRAVVLGGIGATSATVTSFDRKPIVEALLSDNPSHLGSATAKQFRNFAEANGNDLKALAACMAADRPDQTSEDLKALRVNVPVMIVIGTKDTLVGSPELLRDSISGSELVKIEGRDHLNAPGDKRYKESVLRFFKSAPA
jgi:pimeloyl-ACP methyl ester carboxylesterase